MTAFDATAWVGKTLGGKYRLDHPIGAGGMGAVFRATDLTSGEPVAVKLLLDDDPRSVARFQQEARATMSVVHPNVVRVRAFVHEAGEPPVIVMDLVPGETLRRHLTKNPKLRIDRAVRIAEGILEGLAVAHDASIIHRDIKPANVLLTDDGGVKVVDFGIAKLLADPEAVRTTLGSVVGTPQYLAPEQITCKPPDARTDLFAVGVCLYEMLAGARPFKGAGAEVAAEILTVEPPPVSSLRPEVTAALENVVARALAKDPAARFPSARAMIGALRAAAMPTRTASPLVRAAAFGAGTVLAGGVVLAALAARSTAPPAPTPPALVIPPSAPAPVDESAAASEDAAAEPLPSVSAAPLASVAPQTPAALLPPPAPGFTVSAPRPSYCRMMSVKPGTWRGMALCQRPQTPRCYCIGAGQLCTMPWERADGGAFGWNWHCPFGLNSHGGAGAKTGDPCAGYYVVTERDGAESLRRGEGELSCSVCYDPPAVMAAPGSKCAGLTSSGYLIESGVWVAR